MRGSHFVGPIGQEQKECKRFNDYSERKTLTCIAAEMDLTDFVTGYYCLLVGHTIVMRILGVLASWVAVGRVYDEVCYASLYPFQFSNTRSPI
jgi:hypothetical protein